MQMYAPDNGRGRSGSGSGSGNSAAGRGLAGYNRPDHDQQRCYHAPTIKPEVANAVVAPDDGRGSARNMLSHT